MRNRTLILILCLGNFLFGCSSKPGDIDITTGLNEFWGKCAIISDVKKTNGVELDNAYHVSYSYKLEIPEDRASCSLVNNLVLISISTSSGNTNVLKKGDIFTVTDEVNMIKSENGWIFQ